jgi:hypothetical protein
LALPVGNGKPPARIISGMIFLVCRLSYIRPLCEIQFISEAVKDYISLDGSIKKQVNEKIDKLK